MAYSLCIVESPAKCGKIQGFLGTGWKVIATMGHIRSLEEDLDAVGIQRDFEPRYTFIKEKGKSISAIRDAAANASTVFLAADDDREGEAIAYSVAVLLKLDPAKTPRIVFHEITEAAIKKAVAAPRRLDMNRVMAQQARAVLDMMVGFTISPILWKHVGPSLSAGRCQTPALRLLVDREKEIMNFTSQSSWKISGSWAATAGLTFEAALFDELDDAESAQNFLENIHDDTQGTVVSTKTSARSISAPKPLITSTLQQEASALFSSGPKLTMKSAQKLYEAGYITYMRTDSAVLSEEAIEDCHMYLKNSFGEQYIALAVSGTTKKSGDKAVKAQEAHEAIRPTHMTTEVLEGDWTPMDRKIYKLIWQRALQSVMKPFLYDEHIVLFKADGDPSEFIWQATWKRTTFDGWKKVALAAVKLDDDDEADTGDANSKAWAAATALKQGSTLNWTSLSAIPHATKAAGRYTEATLVRELERKGIGRPSTFASLVATVLEKEYAKKEDKPAKEIDVISFHIEKPKQWPPTKQISKKKVGAEKDKMVPSALGISVLEFCVREFPQLFDYGFTKAMEERLDKVATGGEFWKEVCRDTWGSYSEKLAALKTSAVIAGSRERLFESGIKAVQTKKGPLLIKEGDPPIFYGWPNGIGFHDITEEQVAAQIVSKEEEELGTYGGDPIVKKNGKFGWYAQCGKVNVPCTQDETFESIVEKIEKKEQQFVHTLGKFEFRRGPYGIYMFKKESGGKKPVFVSLPENLDPKILTEVAAAKIYATGIEQKKNAPPGRGGFRGRGRGRA